MKSNSFRQSMATVLAHAKPLPVESVPFRQALGRVLAEDVVAGADDPPAPKSAMDGFALRAADTQGASPRKPVTLRYSQVVGAGHTTRGRATKGRAVRLMTGAMLPAGADAVVKQEETQPSGQGAFTLTKPLMPGENVIPGGARMKKNSVQLTAGEVVGPAAVGMLAGLGRVRVAVRRRPRVALLALGDELVDPGRPLRRGQLYVSNLHALEAKVARYGCLPRSLGIAADDPELIPRLLRPRLLGAENEDNPLGCEVVVTLGGSHGGDFDFAHHTMETLGATVHFRHTRLSLGGSTLFATLGGTLLFGLPGTPVPSLGAFELLVRPALWALAGRRQLDHPTLRACLTAALPGWPGRTNFAPAWLEMRPGKQPAGGLPAVTPLRDKRGGPADARNATLANALIEVPDGVERLARGDTVTVQWLGD